MWSLWGLLLNDASMIAALWLSILRMGEGWSPCHGVIGSSPAAWYWTSLHLLWHSIYLLNKFSQYETQPLPTSSQATAKGYGNKGKFVRWQETNSGVVLLVTLATNGLPCILLRLLPNSCIHWKRYSDPRNTPAFGLTAASHIVCMTELHFITRLSVFACEMCMRTKTVAGCMTGCIAAPHDSAVSLLLLHTAQCNRSNQDQLVCLLKI